MSSPEPDPQVVHAAIEEIRYLSGHNVIAAIGARITELKAEMKAEFTKVNARIDVVKSKYSADPQVSIVQQVVTVTANRSQPWLSPNVFPLCV